MSAQLVHPNSVRLVEAWRGLSSARAPVAGGVALGADPGLVANLFVLAQAAAERWLFRSAGEAVVRALGTAPVETAFADYWSDSDARVVDALLGGVIDNQAPAILRASGERLEGRALDLELVFVPLSESGRAPRLLGLYQPLAAGEAEAAGRPVVLHRLVAVFPPAAPSGSGS